MVQVKNGVLVLSVLYLLITLIPQQLFAEDGYRMWLRYEPITDHAKLQQYKSLLNYVVLDHDPETWGATINAAKKELEKGLGGLLNDQVRFRSSIDADGALLIGTPEHSKMIASLGFEDSLHQLGEEGFLINQRTVDGRESIVIAANEDIGVLYGVFHLMRMLQTHQDLEDLSFQTAPKVQYRMANHWDNLTRLVERGYAGLSLWEWGTLPEYIHSRYTDYARFNASIGINAVVLNNVNADPRILTDQFLEK